MVFLIEINGGRGTLLSMTAHLSFILQWGKVPEKGASFLLWTFLRDLLKVFSFYNLHSCLLSRVFFPMSFILQIPSRVLPRHIHCLHSKDILQETGLKNVPHLPRVCGSLCTAVLSCPLVPPLEALSFLSRGALTGRAVPRWARVRASMNHPWRRETGHIRKHPHPERSPGGR